MKIVEANYTRLKCDRTQPCANCARRGPDSQCIFVAGHQAANSGHQSSHSPKPADVDGRLRQLEDQVVTMMHRRASSVGSYDTAPLPTPSQSSESISTASPLSGDSEKPKSATLPDCSNWSSILRELRAGSSNFECTQKLRPSQAANNMSRPGPLLLYGCTPVTSFDELLVSLPTRALTDRLVSAYFNGLDLSSGMSTVPLPLLNCADWVL
jgi:hypothetical protein